MSAQDRALAWLRDRGGDAIFDKNGVALAQGDSAPVMRQTWNALYDRGLIEFYGGEGRGRGRLRLTDAGRAKADPKGFPRSPGAFVGARNRAPMLDEEMEK